MNSLAAKASDPVARPAAMVGDGQDTHGRTDLQEYDGVGEPCGARHGEAQRLH